MKRKLWLLGLVLLIVCYTGTAFGATSVATTVVHNLLAKIHHQPWGNLAKGVVHDTLQADVGNDYVTSTILPKLFVAPYKAFSLTAYCPASSDSVVNAAPGDTAFVELEWSLDGDAWVAYGSTPMVGDTINAPTDVAFCYFARSTATAGAIYPNWVRLKIRYGVWTAGEALVDGYAKWVIGFAGEDF